MSLMATALPSNVSFFKVTGRYVFAVADTVGDVDQQPDQVPVQGTVTFTPRVSYLPDLTATPPVTILPQPVVATLNADGDLTSADGTVGVYLVSNVDPDLAVGLWTWNVTLRFTNSSTPVLSFDVSGAPDTTIDLTTVVPVPPTESNPATDWVALLQAAVAAVEAGGGGGSSVLVWNQTTPASTWIVSHALARLPVVTLYVGGQVVLAQVDSTTTQVTVTFPSPQTGTLIIS